ncbi:hypothetical protein [Nocardia sp. NPDC004860]|uniref:hypothetical protein n=1 Tax=Nocardia sp. NPDC004860 TaxID=3154557 RepID=UPI0033A2E081
MGQRTARRPLILPFPKDIAGEWDQSRPAAAGQYSECEIAFTACVANPLRREGDSIDPGPSGFGINGQMAVTPTQPHFECANPADVITSGPPGSPLRGLADVVSAFGLAEIGGWPSDLADRIRWHRW